MSLWIVEHTSEMYSNLSINLCLRPCSIAIYGKFYLYFLYHLRQFSDLSILKIWSVNYVLHFESFKICTHCLYWSVFRACLNGKIIFNCLLLFKSFLLVCKLWVESINSTIFFWHVQKLRQDVYLSDFSIVIMKGSIPTFQYFFQAIFIWPVICWSQFFSPFLLVSCLSWALDFTENQKTKHELTFESF